MNPPGGGVYQWCGLDKLSKWTMCQVSCDWWRAGHVTTIFLSDWPDAWTGAGAGHGAPDGGDGGGRHAAAAGRGAGQVSCDWRGAGHVTTVLTSDWLQVVRKVVHPKYNFFTYENDLALVKTDKRVR